ncbi:MAG: HEAT repeat domain-containing protein [Fibromonadaceae bacterium]|nr:HEAT repeat domain-containing protein [Fibromonadaceae bacterium]
MFLDKLKFLFLLCLLAQPLFAISNGGDFLVVPSAEVLNGESFQVRGTYGYHQTTCGSNDMCGRHLFVPSIRLGFFNFLDLGVQFSNSISLNIKNQVTQAYGFVPSIALGARAFVQSPEAYFYSVPKSERKNQTGEFYTSFEWNSKWWGILAGVSIFPSMDADAVAPFWGFEQNLGQKFGIVYEGFFRHGFSHHNLGFSCKPIKQLQINAGATEFYRYFFNEDADFGFRTKNPKARTGYHAPGVYVSLAISGGFGNNKSHKADMDSLKKQLELQNADLASVHSRLDSLEAIYFEQRALALSGIMQREFEEIVNGYFINDLGLDSLLIMEETFMDKGLGHKSFVLSEAQNKDADVNKRITAIRVMSHFPDSIFLEPLGNIVIDRQSEAISREAVLALGVINTPESRRMLVSIVNQTSGVVRQTIMDIIGEL